MRKTGVFLMAFILTATVLVQTCFSRSGSPRFWTPIRFCGREDSLLADGRSRAKDSSVNVDFGPNSGVITHPFFRDLVPGVGVHFSGYGHEAGFWYTGTVRGRGYFQAIHCMIAEHRNDELQPAGYHVLIYNAQALNGNFYRIAEQLWHGDELVATEDYSENPDLIYPTSLDRVGLSWDSHLVTAVGYTVPRNEFGMGPFGGCVVVRFDWGDGDYDYDYVAPGIGTVWDRWDDSGTGGYRISSFSTSEPTWTPSITRTPTPTPTPTNTPTNTPTITPTTIPTMAPTMTPTPDADMNHDGTVDELDLLTLCETWHASPLSGPDIVEDGKIDKWDLMVFQRRWKAAGPTPTSTP